MKYKRSNKFIFGIGTVFSIFAIAITISSAIAVPVLNDASNPNIETFSKEDTIELNDETSEYYDVLLTEEHLLLLEGAMKYIENEDCKYTVQQIVEVIKEKGSVNINDIENILLNSDLGEDGFGLYILPGISIWAIGYVHSFPGFLRTILPDVPYFCKGGVVFWDAQDAKCLEVDIGGETDFIEHYGLAVPFFGVITNHLGPCFQVGGVAGIVLIF